MRTVSELHFVVPDSITDAGHPTGGNAYDRELAEALTACGWRIHLHGVPDCLPQPTAEAARDIARRVDGLPPQALVLVDGLLAFAAPRACAIAALTRRLAVLVHMLPAEQADDIGELLRSAGAVITTSDSTRRAILAEYDLPPAAVHAAPPGVGPAPIAAATPSGERLLCVANVAPHKGHDVLVEALTLLGQRQWRCDCVGATDWQPPYTRVVQARVAAAGLTDRIRFRGTVTGDRLDAIFADSDVLVLPSRSESYGLVVGEALSRGLPVIASDVGGIAEALGRTDVGERPGILVAPGEPRELAEALDAWLTDHALRRDLRAAAVARRSALPRWADTARTVAQALSPPPSGAR
jgi:glycosyltransferase involved in cell wall biosynthesis